MASFGVFAHNLLVATTRKRPSRWWSKSLTHAMMAPKVLRETTLEYMAFPLSVVSDYIQQELRELIEHPYWKDCHAASNVTQTSQKGITSVRPDGLPVPPDHSYQLDMVSLK